MTPSYLKYNPVTGDFVIAKQNINLSGLTGENEGTLFTVVENQPQYKLHAFRELIKEMNEGNTRLTFDEVQDIWPIFNYAFEAGENQARPITDN